MSKDQKKMVGVMTESNSFKGSFNDARRFRSMPLCSLKFCALRFNVFALHESVLTQGGRRLHNANMGHAKSSMVIARTHFRGFHFHGVAVSIFRL